MPFEKDSYWPGGLHFRRPTGEEARELSVSFANMDPWKRLETKARTLEDFLMADAPCARRFMMKNGGGAIGAIGVRYPWLFGPYIEFLAILPIAQGKGYGRLALEWVEAEISSKHDNIWVAVSSFNSAALRFYRRNGFSIIGEMKGLVRPGFDEILLRKNLQQQHEGERDA